MERALAEGTQISGWNRKDQTGLDIFLLAGLQNLIEYMDVNKSLQNEVEYAHCIDAIKQEFWYLKAEEVLLVFERIKRGYYSPLYERLKAAEILGAINQYVQDERDLYIETEALNFANSFKQQLAGEPTKYQGPEQIKETYQEFKVKYIRERQATSE